MGSLGGEIQPLQPSATVGASSTPTAAPGRAVMWSAFSTRTECRILFVAPHVSWERLVLVFRGQGTPAEIRSTSEHVPACKACWLLAAGALAATRRSGIHLKQAGSIGALITLLDDSDHSPISRHVAQAKWGALGKLNPARLLDRVRKVEAMREIGVALAALMEAESFIGLDPVASEAAANSALVILEHVPSVDCSPHEVQTFKARAIGIKANSRRLCGDWDGASDHLAKARALAQGGVRDEALEVLLLGFESSLAFDLGRVEDSLRILRGGEAILRRSNDWFGLGRLQVHEASVLMGAGKAAEALVIAKEALQHLEPLDSHFRFLGRLIATDCFITLRKLPEAVRELEDVRRPACLESQNPVTRLQYRYLQARLLAAFDQLREAESLFIEVAERYGDLLEGRPYSTLVRLALFEAVFKRGSLQKAAAICQEAIAVLRDSPAHPQVAEAWTSLLDLTRRQAVTGYAIAELRSYVNRHWVTPAEPPRLVRKVGRPRSAVDAAR